jgi:hypothetical protein
MIMGLISRLRRSWYGPEGCRGLTTVRAGVDGGPDVAGGVVTVAPIYLPRNGPLAHIPLVEESAYEPKGDKHDADKSESRNGENGWLLLPHAAAR